MKGWRYLWLKYVSSFRPDSHCAACLVGPYSRKIRLNMPIGVSFPLNETEDFQHLYLCGVALRGGWAANLHLAVVGAEGETADVEASTGTRFRITNARAVAIPGLEPGFAGKPRAFTTCRCWQFGVEHYGLIPRASSIR